jgi:hypothetical protein
MSISKRSPQLLFISLFFLGFTLTSRLQPQQESEQVLPDNTLPPLITVSMDEDAPLWNQLSPEEQQQAIADAMDSMWQRRPDLESHRLEPMQVLAENGLIVFVGTDGYLYLLNPDGTVQMSLVTDVENIANPSWSPDEAFLAFVGDGGDGRCLYKLQMSDRQRTTLTCGFYTAWEPRWSPDGNQLTFWGQQVAEEAAHSWTVPAGGGEAIKLGPDLLEAISPDWIDHDTVVLAGEGSTDVWYIYRVDIASPNQPTSITPAINPDCVGTFAAYPVLSPSGTQVAFIGARSEGGKNSTVCYYDIYLVDPQGQAPPSPLTEVADTSETNHAAAGAMRWAADNQRLGLLASGSDNMLRLNVVSANDGAKNVLHGREGGGWWGWDWSPDDTLMAAGHRPTDGEWELDKVSPEPPDAGTFTPLAQGRGPAWSSLPLLVPVDLEARGIEVTQAIQRYNLQNPADATNNNIRLVAGKETIVRVYPRILNQGTDEDLTTSAHIWANLPDGSRIEGIPLNARIVPQQNPNRDMEAHSLNFRLDVPSDYTEPTITIVAEVNADRGVPEANLTNNTISATLNVVQLPTMQVIGVRVRYEYNNQTADAPPGEHIITAAERLRQIYPLGGADNPQITPHLNFNGTMTISCDLGSIPEDETFLDNCWAPFAREVATTIQTDDRYSNINNPRVYALLPERNQAPGWWIGYGDGTLARPVGLGRDLNNGVGDRSGNLMAHEFGHTFSRGHSSDLNNAPINQVGFNTIRNEMIPRNYHDIMSYVFGQMWISPASYEGILQEMEEEATAISQTETAVTPSGGVEVLIVGTINEPDLLMPGAFYVVERMSGTVPGGTGEYAIELLDENDFVLVSHLFDIDFTLAFGDGETAANMPPVILAEWVPFDPLTQKIVIRHGTEVLAERQLSENEPQATVIYPNGGENWVTGDLETITWLANDDDGDPLTYAVRYRPAPDAPWTVLATGLTTTMHTINTAELAGGEEAAIQVLATDGVRTGIDLSDGTFSVERQIPSIYLLAPEAGVVQRPYIPFALIGYAFDPEDGMLSGESICWHLSDDIVIGCGTHVSTSLAPGRYVITLKAVDSDLNETAESVIVQVGHLAYLPMVKR